jgi:hypothetical protein
VDQDRLVLMIPMDARKRSRLSSTIIDFFNIAVVDTPAAVAGYTDGIRDKNKVGDIKIGPIGV